MSSKPEEDEGPKKVILFGRDIREIPCFRNSLIFGITGGIFSGLISFMFTSKTAFSTNIAFVGIGALSLAYWFPCRFKYESNLLQVEKLKESMRGEKLPSS